MSKSEGHNDPCFSGRKAGTDLQTEAWYHMALEKKALRAADEHAARLSNRVSLS